MLVVRLLDHTAQRIEAFNPAMQFAIVEMRPVPQLFILITHLDFSGRQRRAALFVVCRSLGSEWRSRGFLLCRRCLAPGS